MKYNMDNATHQQDPHQRFCSLRLQEVTATATKRGITAPRASWLEEKRLKYDVGRLRFGDKNEKVKPQRIKALHLR
jgi:hypothetical protein